MAIDRGVVSLFNRGVVSLFFRAGVKVMYREAEIQKNPTLARF
jgi:hypothetical protein